MSSSSGFPTNSWVWLKQPDYPWWPAMVLDPAQCGEELPDGCDLALLCGPTSAASLAFAVAADGEQVRAFRGAEADAGLIRDGSADESCAAAINEMIAAAAAAPVETTPAPATAAADAGGDAVDWEALMAESEAAMAAPSEGAHSSRHKDKKHRKEHAKKDRKRDKKDKKKRSHRRHRSEEAADSASSGSDDDESGADGESEDEDNLFRRRNGTTSSRTAAKKAKYERQSHLEEYDTGSSTVPAYSPRNDPDYLYRKVKKARRGATVEELAACAAELRDFNGRCLGGAASPADVEAPVLRVLQRLTSVDVTVAQLQQSGVGVAVGGLLRSFTPPVVQLAQAILNYWFHSLPQNTQQQLATETEVDRASVDTCASGGSEGKREGELRRLGVTLYDAFTNEEINDAPASADVVEVCHQLEEALEKRCDADAQMHILAAFGKDASTGKSLRRLVLEGRITADDIVKHANDLPTLIRSHERRPPNILTHTSGFSMSFGSGSPTSPNEVFSPSGDGTTGSPTFGSPTGRTTTALYTCPHCGANDAYHSSYTVQAHDNMPDILLCKKCGMTWNVSDQ